MCMYICVCIHALYRHVKYTVNIDQGILYMTRVTKYNHTYICVYIHVLHRHLGHTAFAVYFSGPKSVVTVFFFFQIHVPWSRHVAGWRRCIGGLTLQVIFRKRATNYRALLRKITTQTRHAMHLGHPVYLTTVTEAWRSNPLHPTATPWLKFKFEFFNYHAYSTTTRLQRLYTYCLLLLECRFFFLKSQSII